MLNHINKLSVFFRINGLQSLVLFVTYKVANAIVSVFEYISKKTYIKFEALLLKKYKNSKDLQRNKILKDNHQGQEALIIATGPSASIEIVKQQVNNKVIITVNEGFIFLNQYNVSPNYVIINDDNYFIGDRKNVLSKLIIMLREMKVKALLPLKHKEMIISHFEDCPTGKIFFYHTFPSNIDTMRLMDSVQFDFELPMPSFPTVTHCAMVFSMFIGCMKTYLLGVDLDYIITSTKTIRHCYDGLEGFEKSLETCIKEYERTMNWSFELLLQKTQEQLQYFKIIKALSQRKQHTIINLSNQSCLEEFVFGSMS